MCTQPFVFVSNEIRSAIIRGWTGAARGGLTGRRGARRKQEGRGGLRCKERMAGDRLERGGEDEERRAGGGRRSKSRWDEQRDTEERKGEESGEEMWNLRKVESLDRRRRWKGSGAEKEERRRKKCGEKYLCALNNVKRLKAHAALSRGQKGETGDDLGVLFKGTV